MNHLTNLTAAERNQLQIAIFCGGKMMNMDPACRLVHFTKGTNLLIPNFETHYHIENLSYNTWAWILPVLDRIEKLGYDTEMSYNANTKLHTVTIGNLLMYSSESESKLQATFEAVLYFARWFGSFDK